MAKVVVARVVLARVTEGRDWVAEEREVMVVLAMVVAVLVVGQAGKVEGVAVRLGSGS